MGAKSEDSARQILGPSLGPPAGGISVSGFLLPAPLPGPPASSVSGRKAGAWEIDAPTVERPGTPRVPLKRQMAPTSAAKWAVPGFGALELSKIFNIH